jgi:hypothetical protein
MYLNAASMDPKPGGRTAIEKIEAPQSNTNLYLFVIRRADDPGKLLINSTEDIPRQLLHVVSLVRLGGRER